MYQIYPITVTTVFNLNGYMTAQTKIKIKLFYFNFTIAFLIIILTFFSNWFWFWAILFSDFIAWGDSGEGVTCWKRDSYISPKTAVTNHWSTFNSFGYIIKSGELLI